MEDKKNFVHLHCHSDMSQLDGCGKISEYAKCAKNMGQTAIALTEHGTMRQYYVQMEACKEQGIKPIYGIEFYIANDMRRKGLTDVEKGEITKGLKRGEFKDAIRQYEDSEGIRDRWHLTVWAQNDVGLKNLFKLSTSAWLEGFYYKPRIDLKELFEHKEGLIVGTGCQSSVVYDHICFGKRKRALNMAEMLYDQFKDKLWLEVMPHAQNDQVLANKFAMELHEMWGGKVGLLATQDAHYVDVTDSEAHEVLLCIGTGDFMDNPDRFRFGDGELYLKSRKQMFNGFVDAHGYMGKKMIKQALDNTVVVSDLIEDEIIKIDRFACLMPPVDVPSQYGGDEFAYTKALCIHGWTWREIPKRAKVYSKRHKISYEEALGMYKARLKMELTAIKKQKFVVYFLLVRDLYNWARGEKIMCGPGRGSAAGSLVSFLLGITSVDPIEHALLFERFINPARIDMPDIDMDFEDVRRQEIIQYLRDKYGNDRVSQIATIGKLSGKQCLKDVSRVLNVPYAAVNEVTKSIIERSSGDERASMTIEDSFRDFKVCREFNKKYPDVLKHARKLEGMAKNLGIHAAGVVTSPVPLVDIIPLEVRKHAEGDVIVTAVDMYGAQAQGLLKLDVLGLKTLAVLKDALAAIKERHGEEIDLERLMLNDDKVLHAFTEHDYVGIFQYDSPGADKICAGVSFDTFEDVAAMTALNRPGTARSGLATEYVERKKDPKRRNKGHLHEKVSHITSDTMGVIVYQEHVQRIFVEIAGFTPATADSLRKKIAKKFGDESIGKERVNFVKGAWEHSGIDEKTANKIMDAITFFGSYGFNKCITSGTKLYRAGANGFTRPEITVKELFDAQNSKTSWGYKIRSGKLNVLAMCEDGRIRTEKLKAIYHIGIKKVYEVKTESGKSITVTANHKLLTSLGYRKADEIIVGDQLVVMGDFDGYIKIGHQSDRGIGKSFKGIAGGKGTPCGDENPCWIDGRSVAFKNAKILVKKRSNGFCEHCGAKEVIGKRGHEFAHLLSFEQCNGIYDKYHSCENIKFLCNSCHKNFDYFKGERKIRWSKGKPTILDRVIKITYKGKDDVYDVEMHGYDHNFIANGIVSHNSHATSYGIISYWSMFLKVYYPIEFYWSLLKNTPERIKIQAFAKDAKKHGIELLPPDVSVSKSQFSIDSNKMAIRGSLVDIKGVGEKAAESIMANQPYTSFFDFIERVEKRKVHKGVVTSLLKAGALDELVKNPKWIVENMEEFWKTALSGKGGKVIAKEMYRKSKKEPRWSDEERQLIASQLNPLAFGKHPIDTYADFIDKHVGVKTVYMSDENFWKDYDDEGVYIAGVILEVKFNQIGDFHTGEVPSENDRKKMFWGARYANVNVEDSGGKQNRFKFDIDIFDEHRELIDSGIGTPVIVHAVPNAKYETLRANFAINLEKYRKKVENGIDLDVWEKIIAGKHPVLERSWKSIGGMTSDEVSEQRATNVNFLAGKTRKFTGIVVQVRFKYDKKDKLMAFFSMIDATHNFISCICFASNWNDELSAIIKSGNLLSIELDRQKDIKNKRKWQYFFNGGNVHLYKIS